MLSLHNPTTGKALVDWKELANFWLLVVEMDAGISFAGLVVACFFTFRCFCLDALLERYWNSRASRKACDVFSLFFKRRMDVDVRTQFDDTSHNELNSFHLPLERPQSPYTVPLLDPF